MSDVRAFLNSFKTKSSVTKPGKTAVAVEEISPMKRRRFPVTPSTVSKRKVEAIDDPEAVRANIEVLVEFFNDRLVGRLAIL